MESKQTNDRATRVSLSQLAEEFKTLSAGPPEGIWQSPGRVNLIGEHTDYNDGLALPFAIDRATFVAARRRHGRQLRIWSANQSSEVQADLDELARWDPSQFEGWARYPLGVVRAMHEQGADIPGMDMLVSTDLPLGSGLSSSAALEVAIAVTANDLSEAGLCARELAWVGQKAESAFAGMPCGLLDQVAVLEGRAGHGVLVDFSSLSTELIPLDAGTLVVIDTRVQRANVSGAYAQRRASCEEAARRLGLASLRLADLELVERELDGDLLRRARHVVSENARVAEAVDRLRSAGPIGDLLVGSHLSLRVDYEVSCPELDLAVETALAHGAEGARLTGAGLGGCAISIGASAARLEEPLAKAFATAGYNPPGVFEVVPSDGAGRAA